MAVVEVVEAKVTADTSQFDRSMNRVKGSFASVGAAATRGMAVAGAAVAGGAAVVASKGISAFVGFESSMNEVFTLMPGVSQAAMDQMSNDVKNFSKEMGVATSESIPALYQAISAGVPQDNVFEFLETAQMAAVGGVTDLETAVDGISSVVNAYGADIVNATDASDMLFTAVKLGKTDFEQLSRSVFQVAPIAASLGVGFGDVAASLATLTAQGVPTSVAATQIKAAVSELGKEGTKASDAFKEMTGQSFQEFIDGGGNLEQAFSAMAAGADSMGQSVLDSFGSIEAGQAVLALTADGGEAFASAIGEMGASAGATETAFSTMEDSVGRDFDKLKASLEVLLIDIGEKLLPVVQNVVGFVQELADAFGDRGLAGVLEVLRRKAQPIQDFFMRNKPLLAAVAVVIGGVLVAAVYSLVAAFAALLSPFVLIAGALAALAAGAVYAYENFETFRNIVDAVIEFAQNAFAWFMKDGVPALQEFARVAAEVGKAVGKAFMVLFDVLRPIFEKIAGFYIAFYTGLFNARDEIAGAVTSIIGFYVDLYTGIYNGVQDIIGAVQEMIDFIIDIPNKIGDLATTVKDKFVEVGSAILDGITDGIGAAGDFVSDFAQSVGNGLIDFVNSNIIGAINGAIPDRLSLGPVGINIDPNPIPEIPRLAEGGIVTKPTLAMIGEGGESEAVIPLSKLGAMNGGSTTVNVTVNMPTGSNGNDVVRALQQYARAHGGKVPILTGQL